MGMTPPPRLNNVKKKLHFSLGMASLTELSGYLNRKSNFACFKVWEVYDAKLLTKAIRSMSGAVW